MPKFIHVRPLSARTTSILFFAVWVCLVASGCATREVLPVRSAVGGSSVDLSGDWQLQPQSSGSVASLDAAAVEAAGGATNILKELKGQNRRRKKGPLVHVFVESGEQLKITQTDYGLFISFDRAIVEEYRYGEYRKVNVGPVIADRSSGWEENGYVIETLDAEGAKLTERYTLGRDGELLLRHVTIRNNGDVELSVVQAFDRN